MGTERSWCDSFLLHRFLLSASSGNAGLCESFCKRFKCSIIIWCRRTKINYMKNTPCLLATLIKLRLTKATTNCLQLITAVAFYSNQCSRQYGLAEKNDQENIL